MESETKYRRWAWGALIGLVAVIIIAGIVMAMSLSAPEPVKEVATVNNVEEPKNEETTQEPATNDTTAQDDQKTENEPQTTTQDTQSSSSTQQDNTASVATPATTESNIPKTGPEDAILPIVALAICSSLFAYNVVLFKKNA